MLFIWKLSVYTSTLLAEIPGIALYKQSLLKNRNKQILKVDVTFFLFVVFFIDLIRAIINKRQHEAIE